jgi:parallel beta-helix repeat protein
MELSFSTQVTVLWKTIIYQKIPATISVFRESPTHVHIIYIRVNERDKKVPGDAGYVGIVNSTNIIVNDLKIEKNEQGILLAYSSDSRIENVSVTDNEDGIELLHADNASILRRTTKYILTTL